MKARLKRHFATKDPVIGRIVSVSEPYGLEVSSHGSAFEALASSIASQQISGAVARKIIERLGAAHEYQFPTPVQLAAASTETLRAVGFSFAKIAALKDLAAHVLDGRLPDDDVLRQLDDEAVIEHCTSVRGIGRWTVQMLLMFHFSRPDVMPADDYGVRNGFRLAYGLKSLPKPKALLAYADRWKPHRSAGAWYLWRAVDLHQQGKLPKRVGRAPRIETEKPRQSPVRKPGKLKMKRRVSRPAPRKPQRSHRGRSDRVS